MSASVCTIVRGRRAHLVNLMRGLARQRVRPAELVIGNLEGESFVAALPPMPFPVREVVLRDDPLPYARGRNACAETATEEVLLFVDVDCIPGPGLVAALAGATAGATAPGTCTMTDVRYLRGDGPAPGADFARDWVAAEAHPARRFGDWALGDRPDPSVPAPASDDPGRRELLDPGEFWSTCFAIRREDFERAGRFDERYAGYGGEDTDFGAALAAAGVRLFWTPAARAVHQWHAVQVPPLDALGSIVENAARFREKHGRGCMEYWIDQFVAGGWAERDPAGGVRVLREPSADEREAARRGPDVAFS